ncbi:MAG: phospho-N-acetylmuramoyl-pentapeptide-transferase [Bacteroidota bacterium]|jgi:phospho-N-acetylmuramoyl-pentapeptide-transferase|nr:phospho-N-acetylmuramoyl-pentapeptide-transferase [Bacteroidota bacterium]HOF54596.1 phospho-N-acetylmuramoyl-pentapeptide-transferase [Prolixibacteraceae bacterium]HOR99566.1 phospho-N-acetylmuramoyl-pentapeptide-transferase [Prolixibacteraceae bacterium]HOS88983.1 phospho-N-acetylmuramoyl-pentapeptide-transferase [Prolixibacteraceae bacterium]HPL44389.1 phospho-N-acetylmuramoyl-pentapeptide-transferase [Prolixibacteraceae bacterium]
MLYYLYEILKDYQIPGIGMAQYISFRTAGAIILSLFITTVYGKRLIRYLKKKQIGEDVRDLGLEGQLQKKGTPTMGGIIIIAGIIIPTLLFARIGNVYIILMLITTIWLGLIGFADDYIKVFRMNKKGLAGHFKIIGQISLGIMVVATLLFSSEVVVRESVTSKTGEEMKELVIDPESGEQHVQIATHEVKSTKTTIPFVKKNEFDYAWLVSFAGRDAEWLRWVVYAIAIILIIVAVSNAANLTDGLDGLATGTSAISGAALGILAYVSGNVIYSSYLNIMYIPNLGELTVFIGAFIGSTVGFLWYNSYPAQIFMGDTGSLTLGGILAVFSVIIRKEILIPLLCGIFLIENLSVVMQVTWFKYTKRKYGQGRRIFLMSPIHHHFQMQGIPEAKIVTRFWIIGIILAVVSIVTLKVR